MPSNKSVYDDLKKIPVSFEDKPMDDFNISMFSSFLSDQKFLPKSETIKNDYKNYLANDTLNTPQEKISSPNLNKKYGYNSEFKDIFSGKDKAPNEFNEDFKSEFNNNFMFLGLNQAVRKDNNLNGWKNFHDKNGRHSQFMLRLRLTLNDLPFRGCYITDILKNVLESNSQKVMQSKAATEGTPEFNNCANILASELEIVQPKQLIVFGKNAAIILKMMDNSNILEKYHPLIEQAIQITHYSDQHHQDYKYWFNDQRSDLAFKVSKK